MAFKPGLKTTSLGVNADLAFLASEHMIQLRAGITLDSSVPGVDANGDKLYAAGFAIGKITASGKYAAYDDGASDGTEDFKGFLLEDVNMKDGDVLTGLITHGSVIVARTSGLDAAARVDAAGSFTYFE